jgi:hypothetical protein
MNKEGRRIVIMVALALVLVVGLVGCASTPTWSPGAPDALTTEHYGHAKAAIEAKSKNDAQAALFLLRSDALRMRTNTLEMQYSLARLFGVTNAVDREDWDTALNRLLQLKGSYGNP